MRASIITVMLLASSYGYAQAVTYGAIAYSRSDGVIGKSSGSGDQLNAERLAIHECRENGGNECKIVAWERRGFGRRNE